MKNISIIILTHNRPEYLRRILNYYNEYGGNYNIIIADSSSDENKKRNKRIISSLSNKNILYLDYSSKISPSHKIANAAKYVEEKYCVLCADDDFITPNGINKSVDFLEKNPDFAVAHGYYISFRLKIDMKGKPQFCWGPIHPRHKSITFPDAKSRLFFHFSNYYPTFYGVHRTDLLNMIFKETVKFTNDQKFGEFLLSMLTLIYGKMKYLGVFYAAREITPPSSARTREYFGYFITTGTYDEKYTKFRDCLAMHLSKKSRLDVEESKRVIDGAMSVYLSTYFLRHIAPRKYILYRMEKEPTNYKHVLYLIKKEFTSCKYISIRKMKDISDYLKLPNWMYEGIRTLYRKMFLPKQMRMDDFALLDVLSSKYYDDFNKIRRNVLLYSKK